MSIGTLLAFVIVCAGIIVLRYKSARTCSGRSGRRSCRSCRSSAILICGYMMYGLPGDTWMRLLVWLALGLAIYFLYGKATLAHWRQRAKRGALIF